jgi:hypothetical protein
MEMRDCYILWCEYEISIFIIKKSFFKNAISVRALLNNEKEYICYERW